MFESHPHQCSKWRVVLVFVFICCVVHSPKNGSFSQLIAFHSIYNSLNVSFTYTVYHGICICFASHYHQFRSINLSNCINMFAWLCYLGGYTIILIWLCWPRIWPRGPNMLAILTEEREVSRIFDIGHWTFECPMSKSRHSRCEVSRIFDRRCSFLFGETEDRLIGRQF